MGGSTVGHWGGGHVPPPRFLKANVKSLQSNVISDEIIASVNFKSFY